MSLPIRPLTLDDLDDYVGHMASHAAESGRDGGPVFMPYGNDTPFDTGPSRSIREKSWAVAVGEPEWSRCWGLFDGATLVGHAEFHGPAIQAAMHRARLGMGILGPYRRQGHGRRLLTSLIDWARRERFLEWIDLGVFAGNEGARALYESMGFRVVGTLTDCFRVDGLSIDDIQMALRLADRPA